ncbi:MAG: tRNA lysidine(34) synthetase TilS [Bacteroidaceae bacterium]|nr:tRNA lysidine(34) synthetase TilS [Bacteroidaceae bacterium]
MSPLRIEARRVVLGLSGGADSVALLLLLAEAGVEVVAAHCHFGLRGAESDRDERFVRELCEQRGVRLHVRHFNTVAEARSNGESIEMAARRLRYAWFEQLCCDEAADAVCIAHHLDDNVETFLLNLVRGSGLDGLTGMRQQSFPAGNGTHPVLRPLLGTPRTEILDYLKEKGQPFVTDSTNSDTNYRRNAVRHQLLPVLQSLNPSVVQTLSKTMQRLQETQYLCQETLKHDIAAMLRTDQDICSLPVEALLAHPARQTLIRHTAGKHFPPAMFPQIAALVEAMPGKHYVHGDTIVVRAHDTIEWGPLHTPFLPDKPCIIDADSVKGDLRLRPLHNGDRFRPYGMSGTKLVSDYFADRHISLLRRKRARVLCDDAGIVWVVGYEIDQRVAVTPNTKNKRTLRTSEL